VAFDQSTILSGPSYTPHGAGLLISWASSSPDGSVFQLYTDGRLTWWGASRYAIVPRPVERTRYDVGVVDASEAATDFSGDLPPIAGDGGVSRVTLTWLGGTYLDDDIEAFRIYGETSPGAGIDYGTILATVMAYPNGIYLDGWGMGGWGQGGWGRAASSYRWTSEPLTGGTWDFGIKSVDKAGNEGVAREASFTVASAPRPPAASGIGVDASRAPSYVLNNDGTATLTWNPSP
jgi:hypothetical protein